MNDHGEVPDRAARPPSPGASWSSGLSERQQQIAVLVGSGLTNREISAAVAVSPKTVEYHLGRIFSRLDLRHRRELRDLVQKSRPLRPNPGRSGR